MFGIQHRGKCHVIIFLLLLCAPLSAFCQAKRNADSTHYTDTVHYHYSLAATGLVNNTNTDKSYVLNNALKLSRVQKSAAVNLGAGWIYGRQAGILTNNDFNSTLDCGLYKTIKHFYYWGLANYTTSVSLNINQQEQAGVGVGYNLVDKKKASRY